MSEEKGPNWQFVKMDTTAELNDSIISTAEREYVFPDFKDSRWERTQDTEGEASHFEVERIKQLQDEREAVQGRTFTKWVNSQLSRHPQGVKIDNLYRDLYDGKNLIRLLHVLSGEHLKIPNTRGRMRIHAMENVQRAIDFLREKQVPMENIGNHDIVDGNHRIILGLIWTIILRFQIQDIVIDTEDSKERRSAKDALLLWSQMKTKGYPNVQVKNFTKSWKDGLALNAIIHRHRPDLIDFNSLPTDGSVASNTANLENAFKQAEYLGITRLLEPEDVAVENPDEKSIITYVVSYYHYFNEHAQKEIESNRIGTILDAALAAEAKINNYDELVTNLLKWIEEKIEELNDRTFANSIDGVKKDLAEFNAYRLQEKPPKFDEKGAIEVLLFDIQSQMRADNRVPWTPAEGKLIADVQKRWDELELAEHARELAIHEELKRQERLEQLAENFFTKAQMREEWLKDVRGLLEKDNFGNNLDAVEAAQKKHEAIEMDFAAYQQRINSMEEKADELEKENYHDIAKILTKKEEITHLWKTLQTDLAARRHRLNRILELQRILQTILLISDAIGETKSILSDHVDSALLEEAISRHALLEKDIEMLGCRKEKCTLEAVGYLEEDEESYTPKEAADLRPKVEQLKAEYDELIELARAKSETLKAKQTLHELQQDLSEMDQWIITKLELLKRICEDKPEDLTEVQRALAAHQLEQGEVSVRKTKLALLAERARKAEQHTEIEQKWSELSEMMSARAEVLEKERERLQHQQKHAEFVALLGEIKSRIEHSTKPTDDAEVQRQIKAMKAIKDQLVDIKKPLDELQAEAENFEEADVSSSINEHSALVDTVDEKLVYLDKISDAYDFLNECEEEVQWCHEKATLLENLSVPDDLEEISVIKTRFDGIREDVDKRAQVVDQLASRGDELNQGGSDAPPELLDGAVGRVKEAWKALQDALKAKDDEFVHGETLQKFYLDVAQTEMRIGEKAQIIENTKDTGDTLAGVLQLQRKLATMEREVAAVGTTIAYLKAQQQNIADNYPEDAEETSERLQQVKQKFDELNDAVKRREEKLGQAGHVQTFMRDVAEFQQWLEKTTSAIASEGHASSLADAERLLAQHELLQEEIEAAKPRYENLKSEGVKQLEQAESVFLTEQLDQMDDSWSKLQALSQSREAALKDELQELKFNSDCAVVEQLLANHEVQLQSVNLPEDPVEAEEAIAKHQENQKVLAGTKERVETIKNASDDFADKEDVKRRVEKLESQYDKLVEQSEKVEAELRECHDVSSFLRDATEASDWIKEKKLDLDSTASHHDEWQKGLTRALSAELAANQNRLDQLRVRGNDLKEQYPSRRKSIDEVLDALTLEWSQVDDQSNEKEKELFEEHKNEILEKSAADLERFVNEVESKLEKSVEMEDPKDLASCNRLLLDQQRLEDQLDNRRQELNDIKADAGSGMQEKIDQISERINLLAEPLADRRERIQTAKTFHQLRRNLQDEIIWCDERTQVAQSAEFGESLHQVQKIVKRNQNLLLEIDSHDGRVKSLLDEASKLSEKAETTAEQKDILSDLSKELEEKWNALRAATDERSKKLDANMALQRLLFDIENAEQWLTERELIVEQPLKEDSDPEALMRRHIGLAQTVNDFESTIVELVKRGKELEEAQATEQLSALEKQFAKLKALVGDRNHKIDELVKLTKLRRHLDTVERWIKEKEIIASNEDTGDKLESTLILIERWESFTSETKRVGGDKMREVQAEVDTLIEAAHSDAFKIESWRKNVNNMWDDLVELMETRRQLLETTLRRHRYFADADELGSRFAEKREAAENAKDIGGIVNEIQSLEPKINKLEEECQSLEPIYAGAQREALTKKLSDVKSDYDETVKAAKTKQAEKETNENKEKFDALVGELSAMLREIAKSLTEADIPR
ncbi:Oidioi.mRNA.OKI2018_I69.PAR.g11841.t3.cds [Oikopleura dioica]|nr:Oidioi.mRNA.OKI2018_I69.PAR.g11841.t3.cds [Oikopleura dioica]